MKQEMAFVIAGGSRGLSLVLASEAHRLGYPVALIARTRKDLVHAKREVERKGGSKELVSIHVADLTNEKQAANAFREIRNQHGGIQVLVNNAATWTGGKSVEELSARDVQRSLELNFFVAFNAIKAVLKLRRRSRQKVLTIINMGATSSLQGWDGVAAFCLGKGALRTLSQSLARELQPGGVHVAHLVIDGLIDNTRTRHINPKLPKDHFMKMEAIAKTVLHVVQQDKSCWTFELDVRPYNENW